MRKILLILLIAVTLGSCMRQIYHTEVMVDYEGGKKEVIKLERQARIAPKLHLKKGNLYQNGKKIRSNVKCMYIVNEHCNRIVTVKN